MIRRGEWQVSIQGLRSPRVRSVRLPLQVSSLRPGAPRRSDQGDLPCSRSLRFSPRPCAAAPRGMASRAEQDASHLSRIGPAIAQQIAKRRVKAKLRDDRRPATRANEIWAMNFVHDQLGAGASSGCSRSSISSPASSPRWSRGSPSAAPTAWRCWKGSAMKWDSRRRSASIKAAVVFFRAHELAACNAYPRDWP